MVFGRLFHVKQIVCINWGTKYGPPYINRLYAMVERNITPPFRFVCFCDDPAGIRSEVETFDLPEIDYAIPKTKRGIWPKSRLWGARLGDLSGPVLYLDLDLIVTGSLDAFFDYGDPDRVILARNPSNHLERLGQTSVFRFPVGGLVSLQDEFKADPLGVAERYKFEQRFVTRRTPGGVDLFPNRWVAHFRRHCRRPFPLNYVLAPKLPSDARIVIFPGNLLPQHAIDGRYTKKGATTATEHLRDLVKGRYKGGPIDHIRHFIRPAPWVGDHWRE